MSDGSVTVVAILKDEAAYLAEWIAYHRVVGVSDFLLYDHGSSDGTRQLLRRLARAGLLRWIDWVDRTEGYPQGNAYNEALLSARIATDWAAFIDLDEFLLPMRHETLVGLLAEVPAEVSAILPNWAVFGSDGRDEEPQPVLDRFRRRLPLEHVSSCMTKLLLRPSQAAFMVLHSAVLHGGQALDGSGAALRRHPTLGHLMTTAHAGELLRINHYLTKSRREWEQKMARGAPRTPQVKGEPVVVHSWSEFDELSAAARIEDREIERFLPRTQAELQRLQALLGEAGLDSSGSDGADPIGDPEAVPDALDASLWRFHSDAHLAFLRTRKVEGDQQAAIAAARPYILA